MRKRTPKRVVVFRCPKQDFREIMKICRANNMTRSRVVGYALLHLMHALGEEGVVEPYPTEPLPGPPPDPDLY